MKVDSSIRSYAGKCLVLLAVVAFATEAKSLSLFSRPQGDTVFTLGVDKEALRESIMESMMFLGYDTNDTAVVEAKVNEPLSCIDERISNVLRRRMEGMGLDGVKIECLQGHRFRILLPEMDEAKLVQARLSLQRVGYLEFRLAHPQNNELCKSLLEKLKRKRDRSPNTPVGPEGYTLNDEGTGFVRLPEYNEIVKQPGYKTRLGMFGKPPQGYQFMLEEPRDSKEKFYRPNFIKRKPELTGNELVSAHVGIDGVKIAVDFKLNDKGGAAMRKVSSKNIGRQLAIVLDGKLISAPVLQSEIGSSGQITGGFTRADAKRLANDLNAGALPVPLKILAEETWGDRQ